MDETKLAAFVAFITHPTALAMVVNMAVDIVLAAVALNMASVDGAGNLAFGLLVVLALNVYGLMKLIESATFEAGE